MDRARQWWIRRVWWQKSAVVGGLLLAVALPVVWSIDDPVEPQSAPSSTTTTTTAVASPGSTSSAPPAATTSTSPAGHPVATTAPTAPSPGPPNGSEGAFIVSIVDGDTVRIQYGSGGTSVRVRLIGIDAPEVDTCFANEATAALTALLSDFEVYLTSDVSERDRFDRLLRYLWLEDGTFVNEQLVAGGFAVAREFPPDTAYAGRLAAAQRSAQSRGSGMWAAGVCPEIEASTSG